MRAAVGSEVVRLTTGSHAHTFIVFARDPTRLRELLAPLDAAPGLYFFQVEAPGHDGFVGKFAVIK